MTAKIKLNAASGGGSFSLQAPSSSSNNRVMTLPDTADGTILTTTNPKAGNIIQVLQNTKLNTASTTGTTLVDTGLSQAITLTSENNKILVMYSLHMSVNDGTYSAATSIIRGSSEIFIGDSSGSSFRATTFMWPPHYHGVYLNSHTFLDTPGTGTHTYKIQFKSGYSGETVYLGRSYTASGDVAHGTTPSSLTLMEIAA